MIKVAQHKEINYLGCLFDEKSSGESMALRVIEKINWLKLLWRKNWFLTPALRRLLCNALIEPHFVSSAWYPNLQKKFSDKLRFARTNALDSAYPWVTDTTLGLESLKKSIDFQFELDLNKTSRLISSNNRIKWPQSTWMKYLPLLTNAKLKLDLHRINLFSPTVTEQMCIRPCSIWGRRSGTTSPWILKLQEILINTNQYITLLPGKCFMFLMFSS